MYADDTTLYSNIDSPRQNNAIQLAENKINNELAKVNEWLKINKLSLNLKKSKYMVFKKTSTTNINVTLKIDHLVVDRVDYFNFLGLTIDSQMTWKNHTNNISNKCVRVIGILNRIKNVIPTRIRVLLYNTHILPHINYCTMAWGYESNRLFKLQKRAIRKIANGYYIAHTEPLFKLYGILKLSDILTLQTLKIFHKFTNIELPAYMQNWPLITNNEIHQHNTRRACDLHTFRFHHMFEKKSLNHNIVHTINNTPDNVFNQFNTHSLHVCTHVHTCVHTHPHTRPHTHTHTHTHARTHTHTHTHTHTQYAHVLNYNYQLSYGITSAQLTSFVYYQCENTIVL